MIKSGLVNKLISYYNRDKSFDVILSSIDKVLMSKQKIQLSKVDIERGYIEIDLNDTKQQIRSILLNSSYPVSYSNIVSIFNLFSLLLKQYISNGSEIRLPNIGKFVPRLLKARKWKYTFSDTNKEYSLKNRLKMRFLVTDGFNDAINEKSEII